MDDWDMWETWDVWGILGIAPGADLKTIQAAYAEKAKACHPEDDPEGFIRLREAYQMAVQLSTAKPEMPFPPSDLKQGTQKEPVFSKTPAFDFSLIHEVHTEWVHAPEDQVLDFSYLEEDAADSFAEEQRIAKSILRSLLELQWSRERRKVKAWEALLRQPAMETLKRREYFTRELLDFFTESAWIPNKIQEQLIDPFVEEWRHYWYGTELWGKFEAIGKKTPWRKGNRFMAIQGVLLLVVVLLLISAEALGSRFLSNAYTTLEVLEGYLAWYQTIFRLPAMAIFLTLTGHGIVVALATSKRLLGGRHLLIAILSLLVVLIMVPAMNMGFSARDVREDIVAIERDGRGFIEMPLPGFMGELPALMQEAMQENMQDMLGVSRTQTTRVLISLDSAYERPWRLPGPPGEGHPQVVYRLWLRDTEAIHFPRALAPAFLRELAQDERYLMPGAAEDARVFEIRYTPNLRVVVEAVPVSDFS